MRRIALATVVCGLAATGSAQPFVWVPGSTINADAGDRVVIINAADGTIESAIPGALNGTAWQYTADNPGKDPFIPSFSPDGKFVYLINGGNSTIVQGPDPHDDGHIRIYETQAVIDSLRGGTLPDPDSWIQEITIPAGATDDAVEPICLTIDGDLDYAFFIDATFENLYTFMRDSDTGELTQINVVDTQETPTPLWISPANDFAFFCAVNDEDPVVNIVDILGTPGEILKTISIPLPDQDEQTFAIASCAFPIDVTLAHTNTVVQPPVNPIDQGGLNELWIFSGFAGLQTAPGSIVPPPPFPPIPIPVPRTRFEDPFNVYKLDISSGDADVMELTNGGVPEYMIDPDDDFVVFPPFIQANDKGEGIYAHIGGSTVITPDGTQETLVLPDGHEAWFPILGWMHETDNAIFVSGASEAKLPVDFSDPDNPPLTFEPAQLTSYLYRFDFPDIVKGTTTELAPVVEFDRGVNFIVGQTEDHLVVGASDTFLVNLLNDLDDSLGTRNTLFYLVDHDAVDPQASLIEVDLGLVGGAIALQPLAPPTGDAPEADLFIGATPVPVNGGPFDFGTVPVGTSPAPTLTFTLKNTGTAAMTVADLDPPGGVIVLEGLSPTIPAQGQDDFTLQLVTDTERNLNGNVLFTTNDANEANYSFMVTGTVTAGGGNQAPTDIALSNSSVGEGVAADTVVGGLTTTDPDVGDTHTYSIQPNGKGTSPFGIDGSNLVVLDSSLLDVTVSASETVTIRTQDLGGLFYDEAFDIVIEPNVLLGGNGPVRFLGDANGDGFVNASDFIVSRNNFFNDFTCHDYRAVGDTNGDGFVNASDFVVSRNNFFTDYTSLNYSQALEQAQCMK